MPEIAPPPPDTNEPANPGMPSFADVEAMAERDQALSSQVVEGQGEETSNTIPVNEPPAQQDKEATDIQALVTELGFKSAEDLRKSYKEQHATITKLSQERSNMAREMEAIRQMAMSRMQTPQPAFQQPQGQGEAINAQLYKEIAPFVQQEVANAVKYNTTVSQVMAKRNANPEEFDELRPYMVQIVQANPHLEMMPDGIEQVYSKAKEYRDTYVRKNLSSVLGIDIDQLRSLLGSQGTPQQSTTALSDAMAATAVPTSSTAKGGVPGQRVDYNSEIKKAQANNDIDKVVALTFARAQGKK